MRAWIERDEPDAVVVDFFLTAALSAVEAIGLPRAALVHVQRSFYYFPEAQDPENWGWEFDPLNATREKLGLDPLLRSEGRVRLQILSRCNLAIVALPREFERPDLPVPANARHAGVIFEEGEGGWVPPWPDDNSPLAVIAFSTTYMHHEGVVERVVAALQERGVRAVLTLGDGLEPDEIDVASSAVVLKYVPHRALLPRATLVLTHAGMGTVNAALAFGVPMVCLPMGRDQFLNAERVEALGCGRTVDAEASVDELGRTIEDVLASESIRADARRMAELMGRYEGGRHAVEDLEAMIAPETPEVAGRPESRRWDSNP